MHIIWCHLNKTSIFELIFNTAFMIQHNPINIEDLIKGDRVALSRSITLIESQRKEDDAQKQDLLSNCLSHNKPSLRIGITGSPGVGKSSFIEAFGLYLID